MSPGDAANHVAKPLPTKSLTGLPLRDWRFWAMLASSVPMALIQPFLLWLYMMSFLIVPNGAIVIIAGVINLTVVIWLSREIIRSAKEAKTRREKGLERRPLNYVRNILFATAIVSMVGPAVVLGIRYSAPPVSTAEWARLANLMFQRGFAF